MLLLESPEIIFNFWYVHDEMGVIYSLKARAYIGVGTEDEKLAMLSEYAEIDYEIARPFPVPERFCISFESSGKKRKLPVSHVNALQARDSYIAIFEDAIKELEADLPAQTNLKIRETPLFCITPLAGDDDGDIQPMFYGSKRVP